MDAKVNTGIWSLAETIHAQRAPAIAPAAMEHARRAWLDTLACMVGGAGEPERRCRRAVPRYQVATHRHLLSRAK